MLSRRLLGADQEAASARGRHRAQRLEEELGFFAEVPVMPFPDWEILPYDAFSPHQDIVSARLRTLRRLQQVEQGIVVVSINTLMQRHFPALKARNSQNMRWKKFLYREICERAQVLICKSPHCESCEEVSVCFAPEV